MEKTDGLAEGQYGFRYSLGNENDPYFAVSLVTFDVLFAHPSKKYIEKICDLAQAGDSLEFAIPMLIQ